MQHYHKDMEGIPKYVNTLKDAQEHSKRAGKPTTEKTLLLIATNAMILTDHFPRADEIWEDLPKKEKFGQPGKRCTKQQIKRPRSRSKLWEAKTNLALLMEHLGSRRNQIKQMVWPGWLLTLMKTLTTSLWRLPQRRLCWKNWWGPMHPSPPPTPNCWPLWPASLKLTRNFLVGWATVKAIKTPGPNRILRPVLRLCAPIVK